MPALIVLLLVAGLGYAGYAIWFAHDAPPQSVEEATTRARTAAGEAVDKMQEAVGAAMSAAGPAAERAGTALREGAARIEAQAHKLGEQAGELVDKAGDHARAAGDTVEARLPDAHDLAVDMQEAVGRARAALVGATDVQAAREALPTIKDVNARLAELQAQLEALPEATRREAASLVASSLPALREMGERTKAVDGKSAEMDQAIDSLLKRLDDWSRTAS